MSLEGYRIHIEEGVKDGIQWVNTKDWHKVDTPARMLGDEVNVTYGRHIGTVSYVLFEDERDAIMFMLSLQ